MLLLRSSYKMRLYKHDLRHRDPCASRTSILNTVAVHSQTPDFSADSGTSRQNKTKAMGVRVRRWGVFGQRKCHLHLTLTLWKHAGGCQVHLRAVFPAALVFVVTCRTLQNLGVLKPSQSKSESPSCRPSEGGMGNACNVCFVCNVCNAFNILQLLQLGSSTNGLAWLMSTLPVSVALAMSSFPR